MTKEKKFIAFDLGAESGRCVVACLSGAKIELNEVYRFPTHSIKSENGFFWDVLAIYREIIEGLTNAQKIYGSDFDGIGIDTWGVDYVLIDSDDRILGYPYHYRDDRTDSIMKEVFRIIPKEKIYSRTGIQAAQFNTLFQLLSEKKKKLNLLHVADKFLLMPDFLSFLLSRSKKAEYSIASTTGLTDPAIRNWAWDLIDEMKLPRHIFPEIIEPGCVHGCIISPVAEKTRLNDNIPIIASASHDTASAVVSVPASEGSWAFLSSGTWSLMGIEIEKPLLTQLASKYNFTNEGGFEGTTRFLKNIIGLWPIQECRRFWQNNSNSYDYTQLKDLAEQEGFVNSWIDLDDPRFLKAGNMPNKIISYLKETGQSVKSNAGFIIRVVLESLAFSYRKTIKEIEEATGTKIEKLHSVGGGIQNDLLTQLTADAIGLPVYAGPVEGTVIGNAGVQAIATGAVHDLKSWRKIVADSFDIKVYQPVNAQYFNQYEKEYNRLLKPE